MGLGGNLLFRICREHAAFVESGVIISAASRNAQNRPVIGRAVGCAVTDGDQRIKIFLSRRKYPLLLDAIHRSGALAVNFTEPSTNKSLQLKSTSAGVADLAIGDFDRANAYLDVLCADLDRIGSTALLARTLLQVSPGELAAVIFAPESAFSQTPGPVAGRQIVS